MTTDVRALPKKKLSPVGKLVFSEYADRSKGTNSVVLASDTDIAKGCGVSRASVIAALKQLQAQKLIEKAGDPVKQVQGYRITHWMFREPGATKETVVTEAPKRQRKPRWGGELTPPEMIRCPRCSKMCGGLLKVGWCRGCGWEDKVARIADGRIDRKLRSA